MILEKQQQQTNVVHFYIL